MRLDLANEWGAVSRLHPLQLGRFAAVVAQHAELALAVQTSVPEAWLSVGPGERQHSVVSGVSNSHSDVLDRPRPRSVGDECHALVKPVADAVAAS